MQVLKINYTTPTNIPHYSHSYSKKTSNNTITKTNPYSLDYASKPTIPFYYNHPSISFGNSKNIGSTSYKEFAKDAQIRGKVILKSEVLSNPLPIAGIDSSKFHCHPNIYGLGDLHLMLMPIEDDLHNLLVTTKTYGKNETFKNVNKLKDICNTMHPDKQLYIFESGSSAEQLKTNKNGIVQTHIHYLLSEDFPMNEVSETFENLSERKISKVSNKSLEELYEVLNTLSKDGQLGYKYIAKQSKNDPNKFDSVFFMEDNPNIPRKSQLTQSVFSKLIYDTENPEFYDWKMISMDPKEWTTIQELRIYSNLKKNLEFLKDLELKNLIRK